MPTACLLFSCTAAALALAATATACTEPVDCAAEPHRCPGVQAAAATETGTAPPLAPAAADRPGARMPRPAARPGAAADRLIEIGDPGSVGIGMPPMPGRRQKGRVPQAVQGELPALPELAGKGTEIRQLVAAVAPAVTARDTTALKRHLSPRLAGTVDGTVAQHRDRFWRHLDKYEAAAQGGFRISDDPGAGAEPRQLELVLPDGTQLKPVLVRTPDGWKIDRF